jgi:hypothetical protein
VPNLIKNKTDETKNKGRKVHGANMYLILNLINKLVEPLSWKLSTFFGEWKKKARIQKSRRTEAVMSVSIN